MRTPLFTLAAVHLWGCGGLRHCDPVDAELLAALPERLSETGLFVDVAADLVADDVIAYEPRFALWSDGAEKRRWIRLPEGTIDTADVDDWRFPVGTRLWKEFVRDGVRVETRVLDHLDDDRWVSVAYVWNADGTDAVQTPDGLDDAHGTPHDVPPAADCQACHGGRKSFVLGFSAVQLAGSDVLDRLITDGRLSDPPPAPPEFLGDDLDQQALGALHANCSHCHNQDRPEAEGARCYDPEEDFDFSLPYGATLADAPALETATDQLSPGDPDHSTILDRISRPRNRSAISPSMPPIANEEVNDEMVDVLTRWITRL